MATILPYNEILKNINIRNTPKKALIDTCALVSFSIDVHEFHDETFDLFETLIKHKFNIYTNVTIRSEFIDYQRRVIITEALTSLSQQISGVLTYHELAKRLKSHRPMYKKEQMKKTH